MVPVIAERQVAVNDSVDSHVVIPMGLFTHQASQEQTGMTIKRPRKVDRKSIILKKDRHS